MKTFTHRESGQKRKGNELITDNVT